VKWRTQVNVKDDDLSLINICFHHYCYLLKGYAKTSVRSCSNIFGIHNSKKAKIKRSDEISLDV